MKKILCFLTILILLAAPLSLSACGDGEDKVYGVYVPDGATALSLSYMMHSHKYVNGREVDYNVVPVASAPGYAQSEKADLIVLPANVAVNLYGKGAGYRMAAVITHGNLFIIGDNADSLSSLSGKRIAAIGKGGIPQLVLEYILKDAGLYDGVEIEYVDDGAYAVQRLEAEQADFALLAEPMATNAVGKGIANRLFDIQAEWAKALGLGEEADAGYPQAALLVKNGTDDAFIREFLRLLEQGDGWAMQNPADAVAAVNANPIEGTEVSMPTLSAEVVGRCNIRAATGGLKEYMEAFLSAVGIAKPDDGIYYS
jgi:NitT/TauT family transport system substrate-binding protein